MKRRVTKTFIKSINLIKILINALKEKSFKRIFNKKVK